jgi:hypothetical protein
MNRFFTGAATCAICAATMIFATGTRTHAENPIENLSSLPPDAPFGPYGSIKQISAYELQREREATLTTLLGNKARLDMFQQTASQIKNEIDKEIAGDEAIAANQQALVLAESRMKNLQALQEEHIGSRDDLTNTAALLSDIQSRINDRREMISIRSHGAIVDELAKQILLVSADIRAGETMLDSIDERLAALNPKK